MALILPYLSFLSKILSTKFSEFFAATTTGKKGENINIKTQIKLSFTPLIKTSNYINLYPK